MPQLRSRSHSAAASAAVVPAAAAAESSPHSLLTSDGVALLKSRKHFSAPLVVVSLRVLSLHRFLVDDAYPGITTVSAPLAPDPDAAAPDGPAVPPLPSPPSSSSPPSPSGYDAVLSDGAYQTKVLLAPSLTPLIERGGLTVGMVVTVYDSGVRYDESVLGGAGFLLVRALKAREERPAAPPSAEAQWGSRPGSREREQRPLIGSRAYYLSLYNDDSVELPSAPSPPSAPFLLADSPQLSLITILGAVKGDYTGQQTVVARVIAKGRLVHFGRPSQAAACPLMFELLLLDATGSVKAAVWNSLVLRCYAQLQVGQVVAIAGFKLRGHVDRDEVELMINPTNPEGSISIVDKEQYDALDPPVPGVPITLTRPSAAREVADGQHVDVCGVCVWAGGLMRELSKDRAQFHCFRYVLLGDEESDAALPVKLYSNSQDARVCALQPGQPLLLTNAQVTTTRDLVSSRDVRSCLGLTTNYSQLLTADDVSAMGVNQLSERAKELTQWCDRGEWKRHQWRSVWQWDSSVEHFIAKFGEQGQLRITPVRDLDAVAGGLRFIECRNVVVQGVLTAVTVLPLVDRAEEQKAEDGAEQSTKHRKVRRGRSRGRGRSAASRAEAASDPSQPVPPAFSIPTSSGTVPVLQLTLSDLNREHEVRLTVCDRPVPYASLGGPGTLAYDVGELPAALPPLLALLLRLLPSSSVAVTEVQELLARFIPPSRKRGPGRPRKHVRGGLGGRGGGLSSSQPLPSTRSQQQSLRARSQERLEQKEAQTSAGEGGGESSELHAALVEQTCQRWLLQRQVLLSVLLYRTSISHVDTTVTTVFSLHDEGEH